MIFQPRAQLDYAINGSSSILTSVKVLPTPGQVLREESLTASRQVAEFKDLEIASVEGRFTRINIKDAGPLKLVYEAEVESFHQVLNAAELPKSALSDLPGEVIPFLYPSRYCQSYLIQNVALDLTQSCATDYDKVRRIVSWIQEHIRYQLGSSEPTDSAMNTLTERAGVCRDFAHLAIAMVRALSIPARYITGYAHRLNPQDFHALFEAYLGDRWCVFDATYLAPLNGVLKIASGRDATDVAVANLFGAVGSSAFSVSCDCPGTVFEPIWQQDLFQRTEVLCLK